MPIQKSELELEVTEKPVQAYLAAPENGGPGVLVSARLVGTQSGL